MQISLNQSISQPTHFTEHSSSLIDIILVSNKENLILFGVADPFLNQDVRFHCPVYGVPKFSKPKSKHLSDIYGVMKMVIMSYFEKSHQLLTGNPLKTMI